MRSSSLLAVDCGASHVAVGRFGVPDHGRPELRQFATEALAPQPRDDAGWVGATCAAAARIAGRAGLRGVCVVGLPPHLTLHKTLRLPRVSGKRRRQILRFELAQGFPCAAAEMRWSAVPVAGDKDGEEVVITAVRTATVTALCAGLRRADLWPRLVLPAWQALRDGFAARCPPAAAELVAAIGARSTQLLFLGGGGFLARTLALGGDDVTQAIAERAGVSPDRAESLKRGFGSGRSGAPASQTEETAVQLAADQFIRRLDSEILRTLTGIRPAGDGPRPTILRLVGGGSLLGNSSSFLARRLSLPAELGRGPPPEADAGGTDGADWWTLEETHRSDLGLLVQCAAGARSAASLSPRGARGGAFVRRWRMGIVAAALVTLAGLGASIRQVQATTRDDRRTSAAFAEKIAALRRLEAQHRATLADLQAANSRILSLQRLAGARSAWVGFAAELQERLAKTGDAWLERLQLMPAAEAEPVRQKLDAATAPNRAAARPPASGRRLILAACLFDPDHMLDRPGEGTYRRAKALLEELRASPYVAAVTDERFDAGQPGVLRCTVTLELASGLLP